MTPHSSASQMLGPYFVLLLLVYDVDSGPGGGLSDVSIMVPPAHIALSGDLHVKLTSAKLPPLLLQVSRVEGVAAQPLTTMEVLPDARAVFTNVTMVKIPCGLFSRGGQYYVLIKKQNANGTTDDDGPIISRGLDVRWPLPRLSLTPENVQTYPERPVTAILEFPDVVCPPIADSAPSAIPEFWLELHYCGHSLLTCDNLNQGPNQTNVQVLYSEQVRGFPGRRMLTLRCELFGLAGHYALQLRPTTPTPTLPNTAAYVKADWSEQFVFNVHARSIFPCESHSGGITVLFQYPSCILASGDRVRLFARLRANVASLAPPSSLEYVAEQRVTRGQHSLHFDCDLFSERYVEYCFVYVSQAITGAVADVRMDCVPTLPVADSETMAGWGPWSAWTPCSSSCVGGTRNRYRFCDNPPPRYGAKFCEGSAVETDKCGTEVGTAWECLYGNGLSGGEIAAERPEVQAEVGPYCRCGCVVHLGKAKPRRILATSSQSCPGRTFWLIQADENHMITFKVEQFRLPCGTQWLKVRDGSSLSATLLVDLTGSPDTAPTSVTSSGANLLLEFFSDEVASGGQICGGGFLAYAMQTAPEKANITNSPVIQGVIPAAAIRLTAVHMAAILFLSLLLIATALLCSQYVLRYRKYQVAYAEDQDSLADPSAGSSASLALRTRASSSATLLSEVISLTRLRPHVPTRNRHMRLRESMDCETGMDDEATTAATTAAARGATLAKEEESMSCSSTLTLTHQDTTATTEVMPTAHGAESLTSADGTISMPGSPRSDLSATGTLRRSNTLTSSQSSSEKTTLLGGSVQGVGQRREDVDPTALNLKATARRLSNVSTATLTNGCYSPAASTVSTATIRSTNAKESKDKRNRAKALAGPGSEFSLAGPDADLELDYYDYNVVNAGAAPGSYLGMDPAFLVWIPPLDDSGEILGDSELRPKQYVDPGSNQESPEEEMLLPKGGRNNPHHNKSSSNDSTPKSSPLVSKKFKKIHPLILTNTDSMDSIKMDEKGDSKCNVSIQLHEFPKTRLGIGSPARVHQPTEKETRVEKSPTVDSSTLDDIKFADDEEDAGGGIAAGSLTDLTCNNSYQDSNILSSS